MDVKIDKPIIQVDILSLFPEYFRGPLDESIIKKARERGLVEIRLTDIRDFADNRYRKVDDRPYGGGPGMIMMAPPVKAALEHVRTPDAHVVYLSPQGEKLTAAKSRALSKRKHLILLCGHYEGIDHRLQKEIDEEISIGDFVLTNGCLAAIVVLDSVIRFVPLVLGNPLAAETDSFENNGFLDYPHYTRPRVFEEMEVPEVLLNGNHQEIAQWRKEQAFQMTRMKRPDLLENIN